MRLTIIISILFFSTLSRADIPANYYAGTSGLSGDALKSKLHSIIKGHKEFSYGDVWNILKEADRDPNNPNRVIGIHSGFSMAASDHSNNDGWNREHIWAKSKGDFGTSKGPGTDVHHLRASDISTNSKRGNKHFAESSTPYTDNSGNYKGVTGSYYGSNTWETRAEMKGDVARMIFYMATRYEGDRGEPDLEIVESISGLSTKAPKHGKLSDLLAWHKADPVSQEERKRNDIIYSYQNNRNPFIDHPEFVNYIWGGDTPSPTPDPTPDPNPKPIPTPDPAPTPDAPDDYYSGTKGLSGDALKSKLNSIIKGHTEFSYSSSSTDTWDILKDADQDPDNTNNIKGIHSGFSIPAAGEYSGGNGWNREHIWPQSRGGFGTSRGAGTDVHHLRASDISTNSARGNKFFAESSTPYIDKSGTYSGATGCFTSDNTWEPRAEVKGDVARMVFYMATRYEGQNGEPDLEIVEDISSISDAETKLGKLSDLLAWHKSDPVSKDELRRNEVVFSYQKNRNPFIDHPEFVNYIWGNETPPTDSEPTPDPGSGEDNSIVLFTEYLEGEEENKALEISNIGKSEADLSKFTIYKQTNGIGDWSGGMQLKGSLAAGSSYVIVNDQASQNLINLSDVATSSAVMSFNGNDPIGLFKDGILVDVIGEKNSSSDFSKNEILKRQAHVSTPNTQFKPEEWQRIALTNTQDFGLHSHDPDAAPIAVPTGVAESSNSFEAYWNQANTCLQIKRQRQEDFRINVVDYTGKLVLSRAIKNGDTCVDFSGFSKGIYVLLVEGREMSYTMKFTNM
ncbi:endonuclease [Reichenbachiella versicolor]|uniref:endonuclease n=1 Tax=Reichenbachiella versicolor TaxID=1821036 RepID=UPI000D6E7378|nr:endonuclease [Reichenbachiella versicolor]